MTYRTYLRKMQSQALSLNKEESAVKLIILEVCSLNTSELFLKFDEEIENELLLKLEEKLHLYLFKNIPPQYIIGYTYFYRLKLMVSPDVLIPRYETELLVEEVLKNCPFDRTLKIIDIGCGSGAIALALKKERPNSLVTAVDISEKAIAIAISNAQMNNLDIEFVQSDLFKEVKNKFDVIVSNPPYIAFDDCEVENIVKENEPHSALFADDSGLFFYEEILKQSRSYLNTPGLIAFEIPYNKDQELKEIVNKYYQKIDFKIIKDLNNKSRILIIKKLLEE